MHRVSVYASLVVLALVTGTVSAQVNFDVQAPTCTNIFPIGIGALGDPEGVSWNGIGFLSAVSPPNTIGMPTTGNQFLRVAGNGPLNTAIGTCPTISPTVITSQGPVGGNTNIVWIPVPAAAPFLSFDWDWYNAEGGTTATFNDGCRIDLVDAVDNVLTNLVCVDSGNTTVGFGVDNTGTCISFGPEVGANNAPETFAGVPAAGSAFIRVASWNGGDNAVSSHCVVDNVAFAPPCLLTISGVNVGPSYSISIANSNCNPFALTYTCITVLPTTIGWFFGIDPSIGEILSQVNSGVPPFIQVLDASGNSLFVATLPFNGPLGIPINGVTVYLDALFVPTTATPPTSVTI
jgi:hypothetical protein